VTGPQHRPGPPPGEPNTPGAQRPEDVVTGFWLWTIALPLLLAGYISDAVVIPTKGPVVIIVIVTVLFVLVVATLVLTFLLLMRSGYRWARSTLTIGAMMSIVFTVGSLFTTERPPVAAVIYAATGIIGVVLLAGGIVLLHRKDADAFFVR